MNREQIIQVLYNQTLPDSCKNVDYKETLNSWVIRSDHFAFKILKPCQATGVDLSEVEERKELCYKEYELNRQLTGKVYEGVIPIKKAGPAIQGMNAEVVDYAVKMKRLDDSRKLIENIRRGDISNTLIEKIVMAVIAFHQKALVVSNPVDIGKLLQDFEEISRCSLFVQELMGNELSDLIEKSIHASYNFLNTHQSLIDNRSLSGKVKEIHGNLSAEKIYMYNKPVIVDRQIIDDNCRQMDVLFDIARLGVDFDFHGMQEYDNLFFTRYLQRSGENIGYQLHTLYTYYKFYHTNLLITKKIDETTIFQWTDLEKTYLIRLFNIYKDYMIDLDRN